MAASPVTGSSLAALGSGTPALAMSAQARRPDNLLSGAFSPEKVGAVLIARDKWHPFATAAEREAWNGLPQEIRQAFVSRAEQSLGAAWPTLPASLFLEFVRNGNRSNYERVLGSRRERLRSAVMAECVEGRGRFADEIADGVWTICEESFWGNPAHLSLQKAGFGLPDVTEPIVDLGVGETASLLAWTSYLLGPQLDKVSRFIRERVYVELNRRILTPNLERNDFWWMGFPRGSERRARMVNNWNPWINSNWLTVALLMERDDQRRRAAVYKVLRSLDNFLNSYADDGGCDEGPSYWGHAGASLFDCLELLHSASGGAIDFYRVPLVQEIGRYIYRVYIHDRYFINFADASARVGVSADLVFRYGRRIGDERMAAFGAFIASQQEGGRRGEGSLGRLLPALFHSAELKSAKAAEPLLRDVWLPGIQVMAARMKDGSPEGLYLAAKGGHNAESHNHNDIGSFIVYANGQPALIDAGVGTYTAQTFSSRRYELWTMQSAFHNLPTIKGVMQKEGRQFAARDVSYRAGDTTEFSLDIAGAYPPEAGLERWERTFRFKRGAGEIEIEEQYALKKPAAQITLSLMTPANVRIAPGKIVLSGAGAKEVTIQFDAAKFTAASEEIKLDDGRLRGAWGERLNRILLRAERPANQDTWTVRIS